MEQTAQEVSTIHIGGHRGGGWRPLVRSRRGDQPEPSVWALMIVMADVDAEHALEVRSIQDEKPVETLRSRRPDPTLRVGRSGTPHQTPRGTCGPDPAPGTEPGPQQPATPERDSSPAE